MNQSLQEIKSLRQKLHANPDLSGAETATAAIILEFLEKQQPSAIKNGIGGAGIVATYDSGKPGKTILFRSELDALPIEEINTFAHRSSKKDIAHKCGHDGHMAILAGLAQRLGQEGLTSGKVLLLFQPAEETGEGARQMLDDPQFSAFKPDLVFALHNLPGYPKGAVVVRKGSFTAAVNSLEIRLYGKTSHAAEPEHGLNPALAISEILQQSLALDHNVPAEDNFAVVTPVHALLGSKAYGTSAGYGEVDFTLRCWTNKNLRHLESQILNIARASSEKYQLKMEHKFLETFYANQNHPEAVEVVRKAALKNNYELLEREYPFKWGEDFGLFTERFKGCLFGLGTGENCPALHNPDYDFPDEILEHGINMFAGITKEILQ